MKYYTIPQFVASLRYQKASSPSGAEVAKRARFLEKFPDQEANLIAFQDNPACKCGQDIVEAVQADNRNINETVRYIENGEVTIVQPTQVAGRVMTIADTPEAWAELFFRFRTENFLFRGLSTASVVEDGVTKIRVFFY